MNPARTTASALPAQVWTALWLYFTAPPLAMLLAAEVYVRLKGAHRVICAKLHHQNNKRCIFRCGYKKRKSIKSSVPSDTWKLIANSCGLEGEKMQVIKK